MEPVNLNELAIDDHSGDHRSPPQPLEDFSAMSGDGSVTVYFRNIEEHLVRLIGGAPMVVGCVAWLTSEAILGALARVPYGVSIVVQKEDFLRPDFGVRRIDRWRVALRRMYTSLECRFTRYDFPTGLVGSLSVS